MRPVALALAGVRLWDGASDALRPGLATLRIEDGRIVGLGDSPELERDAERIDLRGAVALPGLCDAHVHLTLGPRAPRGGAGRERRSARDDGRSARGRWSKPASPPRATSAGPSSARSRCATGSPPGRSSARDSSAQASR